MGALDQFLSPSNPLPMSPISSGIGSLVSGGGGGFLQGLMSGGLSGGLMAVNPILGVGAQLLGGLLGGGAQIKQLEQAKEDIMNLPGMDGPQNIAGSFGSSQDGYFNLSPELAGLQSMASAAGQNLMGGGMFNVNPQLAATMGNMNFGGAMGQLDQATQMQLGQSAFGGLGGQYQQGMQALNMLGNNVMQGPQDLSGQQANMFSQGAANMAAAGNQQAIYDQSLATMRRAAEPFNTEAQNQMMTKLHGMGMLGSTGGAGQMEALLNSQQQADLGFQNQAFDRALGQQQFLGNLGSSQMGMGSQLMGQGLNQFNQNVNNMINTGQYGASLEGQQFGQNYESLNFGTNQAMNRLTNMMGLFGMGNNAYLGNVNAGAGLGNLGLGFGEFGMNAAAMPYNIQASLLGAGGSHANALSNINTQIADAKGGFLGGMFG